MAERTAMTIKEYLIHFIFPSRCPICDGVIPLSKGQLPHISCLTRIKYIQAPTCLRCGKPIDNPRSEYCDDCQSKEHYFTQGKALFLYEGPIKLSMYRFKYSNRREYAAFYAFTARERYEKWIKQISPDIIIPVPMYPPKERRRGYNQASIWGQALSNELGIPCYPNLIKRRRNTTPQKSLTLTQRKNNLKNAFLVLQSVEKYRTILLVDDIYTTGSTMDALTKELNKYGISKIYFLCICIGRTI